MKNQKTLYLVLGIVGVMLLALALSKIPSIKIYQTGHYVTYLPYFINVAINTLFSAAFCLVVWFMLIKNPGNKTPPMVMLIIGLFGLVLVPLYIYGGYYLTAPWLGTINQSPVTITCSLFVVFGIAGLFTKQKIE